MWKKWNSVTRGHVDIELNRDATVMIIVSLVHDLYTALNRLLMKGLSVHTAYRWMIVTAAFLATSEWAINTLKRVRTPSLFLPRYRVFSIFLVQRQVSHHIYLENWLPNFDLKLPTDTGIHENSLLWKFQIFGFVLFWDTTIVKTCCFSLHSYILSDFSILVVQNRSNQKI